MELQSKKVTVQKSAEELCDYLADVKNFEGLMPENIRKFELRGDDSFVFALKGMPDIALQLEEVQKPNKIVLGAVNDNFPFKLIGNITELTDSSSEIQLDFNGQFNAMMSMMIKSPISKFLSTLSDNLSAI